MKFCEILIFCRVDQTIQRIKIHIQLGGLIIIVVQKTHVWNQRYDLTKHRHFKYKAKNVMSGYCE